MAALIFAGIGTKPADASLITLTTLGTIDSGTDTSGVFGPAGADLTGRPYTLALSFDNLGTSSSSSAASTTISGPITGGVVVTIGGVRFTSVIANSFGAFLSEDRQNIYGFNVGDDGAGEAISATNAFSAASNVFPADLSRNVAYTAQPGDAALNSGLVDFSASSFGGTGPSFLFTATPSGISRVPEPLSLALLAVGLCALGLARRARGGPVAWEGHTEPARVTQSSSPCRIRP